MAENISRTATRNFYEVKSSTPKIRIPIDAQPSETIPDELNILMEGQSIKTLKDSIESSNVKKYDKDLKYNDKHLMILNLIHNNMLDRNVWKTYEKDFNDAVFRSLMVADWLQSHTRIPLKARKLSRSKLKFHSIQFPIHPEKTKLGSFYTNTDRGEPKLRKGDALQINADSYLSIDNVSDVLIYLLHVINEGKGVLNDVIEKSTIKKAGNDIRVNVPKDAKDLLNLDLDNAKIFLTECITKSFEILIKQNSDVMMSTCYPICKSGTYKGDYTYIFGFAILTWAYNLLKSKKLSTQYKDLISTIDIIKKGKTVKDILFNKKRNPYTGVEDPKIEQKLEKIKQKLLEKARHSDVYSVQDYYKTEHKTSSDDATKKKKSDKNEPHIERMEYERILQEEINELETDSETVKKEQIKDHAYVYPIVGRKIMLYTDINHFKYHINESVLSGIGVLMCLDLLPNDIFNNLKLCSLMSGGIFTLKLDSKTNNLGFVYDKKKPLITNMNDNEFSKYAQVIDLHPFCYNSLTAEIVGTTFGNTLDEYDIESTKLLTTSGSYKDVANRGGFEGSLKYNLKRTGYIKLSHLFNVSSNLNFFSSYLKKISVLNDKNLNWGEMITAIKSKSTVQFPVEYIINESGKIMKGKKVPFSGMRKVQNVTEKEIRDALTWDLLLNNWVVIGEDKAIKFKNDLTKRFYDGEVSKKTFGDGKGQIVIKTYDLDTFVETGVNKMPPVCVVSDDGVTAKAVLYSIQQNWINIQSMNPQQLDALVDLIITFIVKFHTERGNPIQLNQMEAAKNVLKQLDGAKLYTYLYNNQDQFTFQARLPGIFEPIAGTSLGNDNTQTVPGSPRVRSTIQNSVPGTPQQQGTYLINNQEENSDDENVEIVESGPK